MMLNETQKQMIREHDGNDQPHDFETVEESLEEVKRLISWLEYVAEHEYTQAEKVKLINVSRRFATVTQPIASKYID